MSRVNVLTVIAVLVLTLSPAIAYRLPTVYSPSNYRIDLVLPEDIFKTENATKYSGTVEITFGVTESVSEVALHASATYINVTSVELVPETNASNVVLRYIVDNTTDILNVTLNTTLVNTKEYVLKIAFDGYLSTTDMYGFYKSSYNVGNITHYLATTQMEATYARRAFPCFDEPQYKATFDISLVYPNSLTALGNMNATHTINNDLTTTTKFATTPVMSTYLVAFIVSDFTCDSGVVEETLPYQVCSRNATASNRALALEVAPRVIESLNSYLGINYSRNMNKLDQIAIPDFSAGAMENWGLITYRERGLLYDDNETSNALQEYIASVIAHELTHQWFGNLVTCKWWSEIFLNEGFATFFEHYITHEIYPQYEMDEQFVIQTLQGVFEEDASTSEALRADASTPDEVSDRFGSISYDKGGSVLRMAQHIVGTNLWKTGLNAYLNKFAHSSTEPNDLWGVLGINAINLPSGTNLSVVMENWVNSPGYPVVSVSLNGSQLILTQKRFVYSNTTASNTTWYVPISYTTSENNTAFQATAPVAWLTPSQDLTLNITTVNLSWIVINNLQTGYYRVNYDAALWQKLAAALQQSDYSGIPEINRAQIVNDAFSLARAGYITHNQLFEITPFLANETSYTVWYPAFSGFDYLLKRFGISSQLGQAISNDILQLASNLLESVPMNITNSSDHIYTLSQVMAQTWACKLGRDSCTKEALRLFAKYRSTSNRPDKNLRSIVYCYGLKSSANVSSDWGFLWDAYRSTSLSTEQVTILAALGCSSDKATLNSYLQKTLDDNSGIRSQDYAAVFSAVYSGSAEGVDVALDFFIDSYAAIVSRYTSMNSVGKILKGIAGQITTDAQISKLESLTTNSTVSGTVLDAAKTALTSAKNNLNWATVYGSSLKDYYNITVTTPAPGPTPAPTTTVAPESTTKGSSAHRYCLSLVPLVLGLIVLRL